MIKERLNNHRSGIALNRNADIGIHFNEPLHSIKNLIIIIANLAEYTTLERYYTERIHENCRLHLTQRPK